MVEKPEATPRSSATAAGLSGIHCVLFALFDKAERIDRSAMADQIAYVESRGCRSVNVLGVATEVQKLAFREKLLIIEQAARSLSDDSALSVTVSGNSVAEQAELAEAAVSNGARWLVVQPPAVGSLSGADLLDFHFRMAEGLDLPLGAQVAPQYLGRSLAAADIAALRRGNPNFKLVKGETPAADLGGLVAAAGPGMAVLAGRGGLEMTDCLLAGCDGFVVAPDALPGAIRIYGHWSEGDLDAAEEAYRNELPAFVFSMQSVDHLICYGKRLFGARAGIKIHDRSPAMAPTDGGRIILDRRADKPRC